MSQNTRSIGSVVKELRAAKKISQRKLQLLSGGEIKAGWLASLETDVIANPPQHKLEVLARFLDTTIAEIYQRAGIIQIPLDGASPDEKQLIEDYRTMSTEDRARARRLMRALAEAEWVTEIELKNDEDEREQAA
ncbi:MAG: helix-turn-helix domain-containing protein [Chloroflexi bacterium]|nr:helix-turn-helix domain-containing protein [Chloroflexota bacterium]